ncbi:MAG: cohesin domain-containing protein [Deltaproteobacteria bacterium]|nr:cohesin domain-containing protein [Deltaproteobacteria bacterium]
MKKSLEFSPLRLTSHIGRTQGSPLRLTAFILLACIYLLAGCAAEKAFKKGAKTAAMGDIDGAVVHYQEALVIEPDNLTYRVELEKARTVAAMKHFSKGEEYQKGRKYDVAEIEFQIALLMDPTFRKAEYAIIQVRKLKDSDDYYKKGLGLLDAKKNAEARTAFKKALSLNSKNEAAKTALDKLKDVKTRLDGFDLSLKSTKPITLKFKDTGIKEVFEIISKLSGINFIFDEDLKDQKISIFLQDATFEQAMDLLLLTNKLFAKVVTENTVIIIPKTPAKIKQYQDLVIQTVFLSHIEAKKAVNLLRALLQLKQVHVNEELNAIIIRDEPERIKLAKKVIEANDIPDAEVMMEVEIIEVSRDKLSELGLNLSTSSLSAGIYSPDAVANPDSGFTTSMTYGQLKDLSSNSNLLFSPLPQVVFNFKKTQGGAKTLANPKIRVVNNGKAKIHIGDRIPIITSTLLSTGQSQTSVQYQDVGVKLNVEPNIHIEGDVTIKVSLEVSSIGTPVTDPVSKLPVAYQIGTRSAETVLNLRDGETQVMGGLIRDDERNTKVSIPLLGEIPVLGRLFSNNSDQKSKSDILLAITPHVLRSVEIPSEDVTTIWSGREDEFSVRAPFESFREKEGAQVDEKVEEEKRPASTSLPSSIPLPGSPVTAPPTESQPSGQDAATVTQPAGKGTLYITAPKGVKVDQEFTVGVSLGEVTNLYGASINLSYDPALLEFVRVTEGGFLKQDGKSTSFMHAVNAAEGRVTVGMTRLGGAGGVSGAGGLFSAEFKAKGEGTAAIGFQDGTLKDPTLATITSATSGAEVAITK